MNAGTVAGGGITRVGDRGYFMNCSHVGHDCLVGNDVIFATSATLGGHCEIGDFVFIGGLSAVHQFGRVGPQVMVGALCGVRGDVIPFGLVNGQYASARRPQHRRHEAPQVHPRAARDGAIVLSKAVSRPRRLCRTAERGAGLWRAADPAIAEILTFIDAGKHRALCQPAESTASRLDDAQSVGANHDESGLWRFHRRSA